MLSNGLSIQANACCNVQLDLPDSDEQIQQIKDLVMPEIRKWSGFALTGAGGIWALSAFKK